MGFSKTKQWLWSLFITYNNIICPHILPLRWPVPGQVSMTTTPLTRTPSSVRTPWSTTCTSPRASAAMACSTRLRWVALWRSWFWTETIKRWTWAASVSTGFWRRNQSWRGTSCSWAEPWNHIFHILSKPNYYNLSLIFVAGNITLMTQIDL